MQVVGVKVEDVEVPGPLDDPFQLDQRVHEPVRVPPQRAVDDRHQLGRGLRVRGGKERDRCPCRTSSSVRYETTRSRRRTAGEGRSRTAGPPARSAQQKVGSFVASGTGTSALRPGRCACAPGERGGRSSCYGGACPQKMHRCEAGWCSSEPSDAHQDSQSFGHAPRLRRRPHRTGTGARASKHLGGAGPRQPVVHPSHHRGDGRARPAAGRGRVAANGEERVNVGTDEPGPHQAPGGTRSPARRARRDTRPGSPGPPAPASGGPLESPAWPPPSSSTIARRRAVEQRERSAPTARSWFGRRRASVDLSGRGRRRTADGARRSRTRGRTSRATRFAAEPKNCARGLVTELPRPALGQAERVVPERVDLHRLPRRGVTARRRPWRPSTSGCSGPAGDEQPVRGPRGCRVACPGYARRRCAQRREARRDSADEPPVPLPVALHRLERTKASRPRCCTGWPAASGKRLGTSPPRGERGSPQHFARARGDRRVHEQPGEADHRVPAPVGEPRVASDDGGGAVLAPNRVSIGRLLQPGSRIAEVASGPRPGGRATPGRRRSSEGSRLVCRHVASRPSRGRAPARSCRGSRRSSRKSSPRSQLLEVLDCSRCHVGAPEKVPPRWPRRSDGGSRTAGSEPPGRSPPRAPRSRSRRPGCDG